MTDGESERARLEELTQAIVSLAHLDFSVRPEVRGSGPMEAVAAGLCALAEELEANVVARRAAEAANESKARFLAAVSHELQTPLTTILGSVELLDQTPLTSHQRRQLRDLAQAGRQLSHLIGNLLDFAELSDDSHPLTVRSFLLDDLLDNLVATHRPLAERKLLRLVEDRGASTRMRVHGDPRRLEQLLSNLLTNAVRYTLDGEVTLWTRAERVSQTAQLVFEVRDTGPGIEAEQLHQLFEHFSRGKASQARNPGGLGIGLSIARRLAQRMGGRLELARTGPEGTAFRVELSLPLDPTQPVSLPSLGSMKGTHVLLVDDTEPVRIVIATMLEILGCTVTSVDSGFAALQQLELKRPDIILLDQQMPDMDGLETCQRIRTRLGEGAPPIISITAHSADVHRQHSLDAGMVEHLTKPCDISTLSSVLRRHLPT